MKNQKGISPILIILIIVGVLVVAGGIWYASNRTEPSKPPNLEKLAGLNPTFKTFLDESAKKYPDLSIDKFTVIESKEINIIGEGFSKIVGSDGPVWTYSPDKTKAVSSLGYYGEPDSSLELYNRKGDKKIELLRTCGTPCSYRGEFWLDNKQFVFIQTYEYYPPNGEVRCAVDTKCTEVVSISLYNLEKNTETIYQSPEIDKPIMLSSWPARDLQIKAACEGLYGKDDPYCQQNDETADWKTYRNEEYGFEVKYPENTLTKVSVEESLPPDYSSKFNGVKFISSARAGNLGKKECMYGGSGLISICKAEAEGGITFIPIDKQFQDIVEPLTNTETISILGKEGTSYFIGAEGEGTDYYIIPLTSTQTLIIARTYRIDGFMPKQLFNQIISTFKFISQSNSQIKCLETCKCMEKCNESGPTYFIATEEGYPECSVNSTNKICCCSGV